MLGLLQDQVTIPSLVHLLRQPSTQVLIRLFSVSTVKLLMRQPCDLQQKAIIASGKDLKNFIQLLKPSFPVLHSQSHRGQEEFGKVGEGRD